MTGKGYAGQECVARHCLKQWHTCGSPVCTAWSSGTHVDLLFALLEAVAHLWISRLHCLKQWHTCGSPVCTAWSSGTHVDLLFALLEAVAHMWISRLHCLKQWHTWTVGMSSGGVDNFLRSNGGGIIGR